VLLYNSAVSGECYKVRLLLAQLGLPYEELEADVVDRSDGTELLSELDPAPRVPTLVSTTGALSRDSTWYENGAESAPSYPQPDRGGQP
jgi:glutathione S-transferase